MSKSVSAPIAKRINVVLFDIFKRIHGDLHVPRSFVIPSDNKWPVEAHGMKFGSYVERIRESALLKKGLYHKQDVKKLVQNGFVLDRVQFESQEVLKCFELYKQTSGVNVSNEFRVPSAAPWPKTQWGSSLSGILKTMRKNRAVYLGIRSQLADMGFDVTIALPVEPSFEQIKDALTVYKQHHANLLVPFKYCIADGDVRYSPECRGIPLGKYISDIRNDNAFAEHRAELEELGINFEQQLKPKFKDIHSALRIYKQTHNDDVNVPQSFVIEKGSLEYPQYLHGLKLGNILHSIRSQGVYSEHKQLLLDLGINFDESTKKYNFDVKLLALQTYKQINGHLNVPFKYCIPVDDEKYPEETRGLKLGSEVKKIRRGYHASHRSKLESIGFEFKKKVEEEVSGEK